MNLMFMVENGDIPIIVAAYAIAALAITWACITKYGD